MPKPTSPQCGTCQAPIIFVRIGRASIPCQLRTCDHGTIAAYKNSGGGWTGRWLTAGEQPYSYERRLAKHEHRPDGSLIVPGQHAPRPEPAPTLFDTLTD